MSATYILRLDSATRAHWLVGKKSCTFKLPKPMEQSLKGITEWLHQTLKTGTMFPHNGKQKQTWLVTIYLNTGILECKSSQDKGQTHAIIFLVLWESRGRNFDHGNGARCTIRNMGVTNHTETWRESPS